MSVRSEKQLAVLLKLIKVNNISLTRKNVNIRQKVWQGIATRLNGMQGAKKDVDGWKRSYHTWRLGVGESYNAELEKIILNVPDDDYFVITVSEDEIESDNHVVDELSTKTPTEKQKIRLHELIMRHRDILKSTADDEPLKTRIWLNISEELNAIPDALKLAPIEWQNCVDWNMYAVRRGRKSTKRASTAIKTTRNVKRTLAVCRANRQVVKNADFEVIDNELTDTCNEEYEAIDESILDEETEIDVHSVQYNTIQQNGKFMTYAQKYNNKQQRKATNGQQQHKLQSSLSRQSYTHIDTDNDIDADYIAEAYTEMADNEDTDDIDYDDILTANDLEDDDIDFDEDERDQDDIEFTQYKSKSHRIKSTPLVKSFKYSNRVVNAIENLSNDVDNMKSLLKTTTHTLTNMEKLLQQQCKQQDETNALLKRNAQLLKLLVEFKSGRRSK